MKNIEFKISFNVSEKLFNTPLIQLFIKQAKKADITKVIPEEIQKEVKDFKSEINIS